jgi:hypothetical protein
MGLGWSTTSPVPKREENAMTAVKQPAAGQPCPEVRLPVGFTTFPGEMFRLRRR